MQIVHLGWKFLGKRKGIVHMSIVILRGGKYGNFTTPVQDDSLHIRALQYDQY
jgi:hypothetical protein